MAKGPKPMRNWAACDPLMRKGGAHQDAKLTHRPRLDRRQALHEFEDWQDELSDREQPEHREGPKGPSFFASSDTTSVWRWSLTPVCTRCRGAAQAP